MLLVVAKKTDTEQDGQSSPHSSALRRRSWLAAVASASPKELVKVGGGESAAPAGGETSMSGAVLVALESVLLGERNAKGRLIWRREGD